MAGPNRILSQFGAQQAYPVSADTQPNTVYGRVVAATDNRARISIRKLFVSGYTTQFFSGGNAGNPMFTGVTVFVADPTSIVRQQPADVGEIAAPGPLNLYYSDRWKAIWQGYFTNMYLNTSGFNDDAGPVSGVDIPRGVCTAGPGRVLLVVPITPWIWRPGLGFFNHDVVATALTVLGEEHYADDDDGQSFTLR